MARFFEKILKLVFPSHTTCVICNNELNHDSDAEICDYCKDVLPYTTSKTCERCGMEIKSMARVCNRCQNRDKTFLFAFSPFRYEDQIVRLVHDLKYKNKKYVASTLAYFLAKAYREKSAECDLVIPVPLHENREKQRGYNQSVLLCENFVKHINLPLVEDVLIKTKDTTAQVGLTYHQRQENLQDAFKVTDKNIVKGKRILLVDDVFTTGATSGVCAKTLLKAGAKSVIVLCVAHTVIE